MENVSISHSALLGPRLVRSPSFNALKIKKVVNAESQSALLAYLASHLGPTENQKMEALV